MKYLKLKNTFWVALIAISLFGSISCTFENEEDYFGEPQCDTLLVNRDTIEVYYNDLTYIFTDVCAVCHNSSATYRDGIVMDSYENVVSSINTEKVIPAIQHTGKYKMPYNLPKLQECEIQRIEVWIENGMLENE